MAQPQWQWCSSLACMAAAFIHSYIQLLCLLRSHIFFIFNGTSDSWKLLFPNAAASFLWEEFGRPRLLEFFVEGTDSLKSLKYNIDERLDHHPIHSGGNPATALRVKIVKKGKMNAVKISDLMPKNDPSLITGRRVQPPSPQLSGCLSTT
ncbi:hypothetical protein OIU78_005115 [Salix suchowensis]|nr:hypothetical protein OIU78_005115 [Salix suchowensis]